MKGDERRIDGLRLFCIYFACKLIKRYQSMQCKRFCHMVFAGVVSSYGLKHNAYILFLVSNSMFGQTINELLKKKQVACDYWQGAQCKYYLTCISTRFTLLLTHSIRLSSEEKSLLFYRTRSILCKNVPWYLI